MTTKTETARRTFHALDAARGIAALIVVLYHLPTAFRGTLFGSGDLAVDFFFGLSGFVLAHAYLDRLGSGRMGVREFMVARMVRLYPFYLLSLLTLLALLAGLHLTGRPLPWSAMALAGKLPFAVLMLPSPTLDWHAYLYPFNIAAWSILLEIGVNLLFALVRRPIRKPRVRWALIVFSGVILAAQLLVQDVLGDRPGTPCSRAFRASVSRSSWASRFMNGSSIAMPRNRSTVAGAHWRSPCCSPPSAGPRRTGSSWPRSSASSRS